MSIVKSMSVGDGDMYYISHEDVPNVVEFRAVQPPVA